MSAAQRSILMVGLPESGKSTYLGALYYLLRKGRDERLKLSAEPNERQYLQELENKWLRYKPFERSQHPGIKPIELALAGSSLGEFSLAIPDISGETYSHLWEDGVWSDSVREFSRETDGLIVFVHPQTIKKPELIDVSAAEKSPGEWIPWAPELSPTQAVLCDLLESIEGEREAALPRTAVIISAWDAVVELGVAPAHWLELELPLLWQWLQGQAGGFEFECFGISAQGGDVADEKMRDQLANNTDPLERIINGPGAHGLLDPLLWLLGS
jgi:hypothetical protein